MTETERKVSQFESDPVTPKEIIGYNMGSVPGAFFGGFMGQIQAFYYRWMGLDWGLIVIAQIVYALWNVLNDPIFGLLMNRTKTKSGRYIPWIKWCAPLFTVGFIFVFFPPQEWRFVTSGAEFMIPLFIWYLLTQILYDTFFTIVYLAHVSLLPQMTMAATERTKISVIYGLLTIVGGVAAGGLPLIFLTVQTPDSIAAFQVFVVVFGFAALLPWYFVWPLGVMPLLSDRAWTAAAVALTGAGLGHYVQQTWLGFVSSFGENLVLGTTSIAPPLLILLGAAILATIRRARS